ncbi:CDGSH iron-sulfur domain-containing protein 1 [Neoarius graeffei]|uniref:CDGSH iron-sulfur domain-containing protein 1 n=1 Tax=Neoarius graeffei TaxID=443677 RepID=UPI00298BEDA3|nr:CDGSH iron-sulfur domain-containing protein 1 [Neoarius graeffei]
MSLQAAVFGLIKPGFISGMQLSKVAAPVGPHLLTRYFWSSKSDSTDKINLDIDKDSTNVVHSFDVEEIRKKAVYCRCWRSRKFPYCDGSHIRHNRQTGDNVGPLIINRKDA